MHRTCTAAAAAYFGVESKEEFERKKNVFVLFLRSRWITWCAEDISHTAQTKGKKGDGEAIDYFSSFVFYSAAGQGLSLPEDGMPEDAPGF